MASVVAQDTGINSTKKCSYDRVILGGGITGWSAAWQSARKSLSCLLLEKSNSWGGSIRTTTHDSYLVEGGPHSLMIQDPGVDQFLLDSGLESLLLPANDAAKKRFVVRNGNPIALPQSLATSLFRPYISFCGKLRLLMEPIAHGNPSAGDEAIAPWVRRHFGNEVANQLLDPFISGIYAGDPDRISLRYAFPKLYEMSRHHSSFLRSVLKSRKQAKNTRSTNRKASRRMVSFRGGLIEMVDHLRKNSPSVEALKDTNVSRCLYENGLWSLTLEGSTQHTIQSKEIICCLPPHALTKFAFPDPVKKTLSVLNNIASPPVTTIALAYKRKDLQHPLDGFGMLCPIGERRSILGVLFDSSIFPGRAPDDEALLSVFMGGVRQPEMALLDESKTVEIADQECRSLLKGTATPVFHHMTHWEKAIPQYNVGYNQYLTVFDSVEKEYPTLRFAGNARDGVSLGACILSGLRRANDESKTAINIQ